VNSIWIDWLVRDGQLEIGKVKPSDYFSNELNSYTTSAEPVTASVGSP
jgi:hypothetical protein